MTYSEFKNKWLGKPINYDNAYGAQCMDVYRMYVKEVLNVPQSPPVKGAKDVWNTYLSEYFDKVSNTPDGVPNQGDIAIWGHGEFGHIGIVDSADKAYLTCFEQNWTEMDGSGVSELRKHNYKNVLGWLVPKSSLYKGYDLSNKDSMKIAVDKLVDILGGKYLSIDEHNRIINELDSKSTEQAQKYAKEKQILEDKVRVLDEALYNLQQTEHNWQDTADSLQRKLKVVTDFLNENGSELSTENDESLLLTALQKLSRSEEIASIYSTIQQEVILTQSTPDGILEALQGLKKDYEKKIEDIKQNTGEIASIRLLNYIIKIYGK